MKFTIEVNYAEIQMLKALLRSAPGTGWTSMQEHGTTSAKLPARLEALTDLPPSRCEHRMGGSCRREICGFSLFRGIRGGDLASHWSLSAINLL